MQLVYVEIQGSGVLKALQGKRGLKVKRVQLEKEVFKAHKV